MVEISGFEELAEDLADVADSFSNMADRQGKRNAREAVETGINRAMEQTIVPAAKENVPKDTGRLAESIDHEPSGWTGDRYAHEYGSTLKDEYARVQEFGTTKKDYLITPNGDYPLVFEWENPPPGSFVAPGETVAFQYVIHPGVDVPQPGPMRRALRENISVIEGHVGNAMREVLEENGL